jgi:hypothetical protein
MLGAPGSSFSIPSAQKWAVDVPTAKPSSASLMAGASTVAKGSLPCRWTMSHHPAQAPGTVTVWAWWGGSSLTPCERRSSSESLAGARPEPLSPVTAWVAAS